MRGNELLLMTANPDVGSCLLALLRASHVLCDRPSLPLGNRACVKTAPN